MNKFIQTIITEEHSSQLHVLHQLGLKDATLIYFDAHLDFQHISEYRLEKLRQCSSTEEIAKLEKPHHMIPDRGYSYSIEDWLYAAHHLGIISHVVWVSPTPENYRPNPMDTIRMLQRGEGLSLKDFISFKIVENVLEATLLGLKITFCGYQDLQDLQFPENIHIDVDIDYFITLPQDRPWIDPKVVFKSLKSLPIDCEVVTLTRSVSSGYMPLRYHFIADYMAALWQDNQPAIDHYTCLFAFAQQAQNNEIKIAKEGCLNLLEKTPICAATYYLLSLCEVDLKKASEYEQIAAELCPSYSPSVLRSTNAIVSRDLKYDKTSLQTLEQQLTNHQWEPGERQLTHFTLGLLYSSLGEKEEALKHYHACQNIKAGFYPQLSLALASLSLRDKDYEQSIMLLNNALNDESTQAEAHLMIGRVYLDRGQYDLACKNLLLAIKMLPSAKRPVKLLADAYKQMGDEKNYQLQLHKYHQMKLLIP